MPWLSKTETTVFCLSMEHKITALTLQKRNPQRVNVYLDGEFAFGLARIVAAYLGVDQVLDDEKIRQLRNDDQYEVAYQRAIKFIDYRPRSEAEVRKNLHDHVISDEIIERVVDRLKQLNLINDARFAQIWIENRNTFRPRSRRALNAELRQRGIDAQTIDESLEDLDEDTLAYQAAQKQRRKYESLERELFQQKMIQFLGRRGFSYEISRLTTDKLWDEFSSDESSENGEE
jgi:regulatory protein